MSNKESGFSLVEVLFVVSLIGVLAVLAVPNFQEIKVRSQDSTARVDFRNLKTALIADGADPDNVSSYIIGSQLGPGSLPAPLNNISLSNDIRMNFAGKIVSGNAIIKGISLRHQQGSKLFQYLEYTIGDYTLLLVDQEIDL